LPDVSFVEPRFLGESAGVSNADLNAGNRDGWRGFRTPCLVISPFARREFVSSTEFDHTSILKMIEWRWGLNPLTVRDVDAINLAEALDFAGAELKPKQFSVAEGPFGNACALSLGSGDSEWRPLLEMAAAYGWPLPAGVA
jgi:phospholipase C